MGKHSCVACVAVFLGLFLFGIGVYTAGGYRRGGIRYSVHCKQALFRSSLQGQDLSKRDRGEKSEWGDTQPTIFVAHIDATKEWTLLYRFGGGTMDFVIISSLIGLVYLVGANIANWVIVGGLGASIASGAMLIVGLVAIAFLPGWICLYFLINPKRVIDGANEDLSGCEVALAVLESMKEQCVEAQNTQIGVILTGSGSVGQRGAQAWCERHKNDYNDVPTTFVCLDTLRETEALRVNTKELNGFVKNDASVVNLISKSAKSLTKGALTLGATDSAEFSRQGFKSASITGYSQRCPQYLHTRYDSFDNVNDKCIAKAYEACVRIVDAVDNK